MGPTPSSLNPCSLTQILQLWPCMFFNLLAGLDGVSNEISIEKCQIESILYVSKLSKFVSVGMSVTLFNRCLIKNKKKDLSKTEYG